MSNLIDSEVKRNPETPILGEESVSLLSELCFRQDDPVEKVDLIFVFSSPLGNDKIAKIVDDLLRKKVAPEVFLTGGVATYTESRKSRICESQLQLNQFDLAAYPDVKFLTESKSRNTLENVTEALKVHDFSKYKKIMFIFKTHAAGRGYLTLKKFVSPSTVLIQKTWAPIYPNTDKEITRDSWNSFDFGRSRVWGEFLRIKKYGERGDIFYDDKTKDLVYKISELTQII